MAGSRSDRPIAKPRHFDEVASNAVSFLGRSVDELLEDRLKYSAVFFYQAVELFIKARLLHEHWSLVVSDPARANIDAFEKGDFRSVSLDQAAERLKSVAKDDISTARKAFEPVRRRRNRAIHFHAAEMPGEGAGHSSQARTRKLDQASDDVVEIVMEQCVAWFELHMLLTRRWKGMFSDYQSRIEWLDRRMREVRPYLQARFDRLGKEIQSLVAKGVQISECSACGFAANQDSEVFPGMTRFRCLVCRRDDRSYQFPCPQDDCDGEIVVSDGGGGECTDCEEYLSLDEIIDRFEPLVHPGDPDDPHRAYCSSCESYEAMGGTVVLVEDVSRYICFSCLQDFDIGEVSSCEWCGEQIAGDTEDSFLMGCMNCEGRMGHDKDD